jgi:hypothetical protein
MFLMLVILHADMRLATFKPNHATALSDQTASVNIYPNAFETLLGTQKLGLNYTPTYSLKSIQSIQSSTDPANAGNCHKFTVCILHAVTYRRILHSHISHTWATKNYELM